MIGAVLGAIEIQMLADLARLRQDMNDAKGLVGDAMKQIENFASMAGRALGALGVAASLGGLVEFVKSAIDSAAGLQQLSEQTGVSVGALSALSSVAKLSGTSMEDVRTGLQKLSKNMVEAQGGTGKAADTFRLLGLSVLDGNGKLKTADVMFLEIAKSVGRFEQSAGLTAAQMTLLGKAGANLGPVLNDLAERGQLVGKVTAEQGKMADDYEKKVIRLQTSMKAWATSIALDLLPYIDKMSGLLGVSVKVVGAWIALVYGVPAAVALAAAAAEAFGAAIMAASLATGTFSTALGVTIGLTKAAIVQFGILKAGMGLLVAAFAGWQIGTWMRENFVEARLAGIAFTEGLMVAWEEVKFAGQAMWLAVEDIYGKVIKNVGAGLASLLEYAADGLKLVGFSETAQAARDFAASIRETSAEAKDFETELAKLRKQTDANIAGVRAITSDMVDEAIAQGQTTVKAKEKKAALGGVTEEVIKARKAGLDYIATLNAELAALSAQVAMGREYTDSEKALAKVDEDVRRGKILLTETERAAIAAKLDAAAGLRDELKLREALAKVQAQAIDAMLKETESIAQQTAKQLEQNQAIGQSSTGLKALEFLRVNDALATAEQALQLAILKGVQAQELEGYTLTVEELRKLKKAKEEGVMLEAGVEAAKAAKDAAAEWEKMVESVQNGLTDALMRAFESGKGFMDAFKDTVLNAFRTMILKPMVQQMVAQLAGGMQGAMSMLGSAMGGGGAQQLSGPGMGSGSMAAGLGSMTSIPYLGWAVLGAMKANQDYGEGFNSSGARQLANDTGLLGRAGVGAYEADQANLWRKLGVGDKMANLLSGATAVSKIFGRAAPQATGSGITGDFGMGDFAGQSFLEWKAKGGLFRSDKSGTSFSALNAEVGGALSSAAGGILAHVAEYADALALPVTDLTKVTTHARIDLGADAAANQKAIDDALAGYGAALVAGYQEALAAATQPGESTIDTLNRLGQSILAVNTTFEALGLNLVQTSVAGGAAASNLISLTGGLDAFLAKTQSYLGNYFSEAEQLGITASGVLKTLADSGINFSGASGRGDLRALMESLNPNTEGGGAQMAALLNISGDFARLADYLQANGGTLADLAGMAPAGYDAFVGPRPSSSSGEQSVALLQTSADYLSNISDSSANSSTQLQALLALQTAANQALLAGLQALQQATEDAARLADLAPPPPNPNLP